MARSHARHCDSFRGAKSGDTRDHASRASPSYDGTTISYANAIRSTVSFARASSSESPSASTTTASTSSARTGAAGPSSRAGAALTARVVVVARARVSHAHAHAHAAVSKSHRTRESERHRRSSSCVVRSFGRLFFRVVDGSCRSSEGLTVYPYVCMHRLANHRLARRRLEGDIHGCLRIACVRFLDARAFARFARAPRAPTLEPVPRR